MFYFKMYVKHKPMIWKVKQTIELYAHGLLSTVSTEHLTKNTFTWTVQLQSLTEGRFVPSFCYRILRLQIDGRVMFFCCINFIFLLVYILKWKIAVCIILLLWNWSNVACLWTLGGIFAMFLYSSQILFPKWHIYRLAHVNRHGLAWLDQIWGRVWVWAFFLCFQ